MNPAAVDFILSIALSVAGLIIGLLIGMIKSHAKKERQKDLAMENGIRCLLREEIIRICDRCLERGSIHLHNLESLDDLLTQYTSLGGNGATHKMVEDVRNLRLQEGGYLK